MLKITINPYGNAQSTSFSQKVITIGSGNGPIKADLCLDDPELHSIHLKIVRDEERCTAINFANDPFVTLNDLPFGKKILKNRDLIYIGSHQILIEIVNDLENDFLKNPPKLEQAQPSSSIQLEMEEPSINKVEANESVPIFTPIEKEPAPIYVDSMKESIEDPQEEYTEDSFPLQKELHPVSFPASAKKNSVEYQVGEFDDENENWTMEKESSPAVNNQVDVHTGIINWKLLGVGLFAFFLMFCLTAIALYFHKSTKNAKEELKAAENVADIAMALKYAQIHHIKPHKKNWSDPEFIRNTLAQVIPHDYPSLAKIDQQGRIDDTSYSLRIYTNTDFSQFLVIAQPAPSFLQWLIPKTALVVDSKLMQLKKVADMKTLNRLLVNSNDLDNSNAIEVTQLVKRGEMIPLSRLAQNRKGQDFSPPKALVLLRPGAENYIYNAPRYYQLGETIMKRAIELMEMPRSVYEMSRLKQEMSLLSKMHEMVLYSSDGIQLTLDAQKAIAAFVSNARFLTAYLKFDSEGIISSSHLIIDDESSRYPAPEKNQMVKDISETEAPAEVGSEAESIQAEPMTDSLLSKLTALCKSREVSLAEMKNQIVSLLNNDINHPVEGFEISFRDLTEQYLALDHQQKQQMAQEIHQLAEEYKLMSVPEFISYLNRAGFESGCKEILKHLIESENQDAQMQNFINELSTSDNFTDLEKILNASNQWLDVKNFADLNELVTSQQQIKSAALSKINHLLLYSTPTSLQHTTDQYQALERILKLLLENPEEQDYFLQELKKLDIKLEIN